MNQVSQLLKTTAAQQQIPVERVARALERALAWGLAKEHDPGAHIEVSCLPGSGQLEVWRCWEVVADDCRLTNPSAQMRIMDVEETAGKMAGGQILRQELEFSSRRLSATLSRQAFTKFLQEERIEHLQASARSSLGRAFDGIVLEAGKSFSVVEASGQSFYLPSAHWGNFKMRVGDRVRIGVESCEYGAEASCIGLTAVRSHVEDELGRGVAAAIEAVSYVSGAGYVVKVSAAEVGKVKSRSEALSRRLRAPVQVVSAERDPAEIAAFVFGDEADLLVVDSSNLCLDVGVKNAVRAQALKELVEKLTGWDVRLHPALMLRMQEEEATALAQWALMSTLQMEEAQAQHYCENGARSASDLVEDEVWGSKATALIERYQSHPLLELPGLQVEIVAMLDIHGLASIEAVADMDVEELRELAAVNDEQAAAAILAARCQ